ncbi:TIGR00730 family Rossman fold protein [Kingella kingae]|uniref:LOG family protein n=1 Tax=Kingella kingae TaxID=504 RepID=UPI00040EBB07|nr:TIGR00730 family Rossman fold protein [Kingella kingae]MDK4576753.1 TIGR00730 family Rossman fold protein [Kingella kingae]MDK4582808.1 TIGR00730 family Rossman fold protein [Kingella kingae]MDK4592920.1 TIGR00730 family Rossman fold protein [Kingella kingae]MDK4594993.1 TIGR00730 family Rossman fold protein [Kingella kingae]MDK4644671.1 TIGR00730 family Rossman fold protein [Kingella kingae]
MNTATICNEFTDSNELLSQLPPAVTIFGSARIAPSHPEYLRTERLARLLSDSGFSVFSGGGPGIMEAANKGAFAGKSPTVGMNIILPHEQKNNPYQDITLTFENFPSRKAMLVNHSFAFVVMIGGFGTLDELFETLTLIQTRKIQPCPVVLVGKAFWQGLLDWLREQLLTQNLIHADDFDLIYVLNDEDEIIKTIQQFKP